MSDGDRLSGEPAGARSEGFAALVRRRRMVRAYDADRGVPAAVVDRLVGYALRAPSAGFTQGVSFLVCDDGDAVQRYWAATTDSATPASDHSTWLAGMRTAPVLVQVWTSAEAYLDRYVEADKGWVDRDVERWTAPYWFVDAGMAAMSLLLGAVAEGLGACFFGVPPEGVAALRSAFGVPAEQLCAGVVSLGYRAATSGDRGSPARRPRRAAADLVHRGQWDA